MLKLIKSNAPALKQQSALWSFESPENLEQAKQLEIDMVKLMIESGGIGLAGNQVGLLNRVFAIHLKGRVPFCMFNPSLLAYSEDYIDGPEGCLSFPDLFFPVKRYSAITAEYFDRSGNKCIIELKDTDARCFQHELDHLNGVCFTEKISPLKLAFAIKKQKKRKSNG